MYYHKNSNYDPEKENLQNDVQYIQMHSIERKSELKGKH